MVSLNWKRGLRRVFWLSAAIWWAAATYLISVSVSPFPARDDFVPSCSFPLGEVVYEPPSLLVDCPPSQQGEQQQAVTRLPGGLPDLNEALCRGATTQAERDREYAEAQAAAELERAQRTQRCQAERVSPEGQRDIEEKHQEAVRFWQLGLAGMVAAALAIPVLVALVFFLLWRIGLWVWRGFNPAA